MAPDVSIVIPTWPRLDLLARCLEHIHANTEGDYEVVVIDNGSEPRGAIWAINRGFDAASAQIIVHVSDDVLVQPGWLPPLVAPLREGYWLVSAWDPRPGATNWNANPWCWATTRKVVEDVGPYPYDYIHWLGDCAWPEAVVARGGKMCHAGDAHVHHNPPADRPEEHARLLAQWHTHDFGYPPGGSPDAA